MKSGTGTILIVEDDPWNARLVMRLLEEAGHQVVHLADPRAVMPLLAKEAFSLLILDQNMPGMDGLTLLAEIRKEHEVPVIMLTGADKSELAVRALKLGAFDYLLKPVDEKRLLETVPQAIASGQPGGASDDRIAHYEIEQEVGRGGMGVVYAARDRRLDRRVALKVLLPELAADPEYEESFLREARIAAQFSHRNIVTLYEAGRFRGRLYIAMELVQGQSLQAAIEAGSAFPTRRVLEIGIQVASAVQPLHEAGMVHRDLKPANLMMAPGGTVKVLDFGLARPHVAGPSEGSGSFLAFAGTLAYVPPEVLRAFPSSVRGDVYGLGIVLYELLAGQRAFAADTQFDLMSKVMQGRVSRPWEEMAGVPPEVASVVRRMMEPAPEHRFGSMEDVARVLRELLTPRAA